MNTHDIEPLKYGGPDSDDYVTGWNDCCARIAQDRQRRGGPVAKPVSVTQKWQDGDDSNMVSRVAEPVKVPSDAEMAELWDEAHKPFGGAPFLMSHVEYSRALLARYGQATHPSIPPAKDDPWFEEGVSDVVVHAQRQAYVDGWNECRDAIEAARQRRGEPVAQGRSSRD